MIKSDLKERKVSEDLAKDRFMIMKALYPSSPGDSNQINMIRRQLFFQNKITTSFNMVLEGGINNSN